MASQLCTKDASLAEAPRIKLSEARRAICYPDPASPLCDKLMLELKLARVLYYINYGPRELAGLRALGRGWAGNVFAGELDSGEVVVVKVLSPKSRRRSMLWEAVVLAVASHLRIAPRLVYGGPRVIVYEYVHGVPLKDYTPPSETEARIVVKALLWKARLLDVVRVRHNELARPGGQVIIDSTPEPYIIDYDSATVSRSPSNVTQVYGGLLRIEWARKVLRDVNECSEVREALRLYKRDPSLENWERLLRVLLK